jgi:hypothetical protein
VAEGRGTLGAPYRLEVYRSGFAAKDTRISTIGRERWSKESGVNEPSVVIVAVNVQDLLALDTQNTASKLSLASLSIITGDLISRTQREYTQSDLATGVRDKGHEDAVKERRSSNPTMRGS